MAEKKIKVFWLSAELAPLAKTGGLGDVAGALPPALVRLGVDVRLVLPYYGSIKTKAKLLMKSLVIPDGLRPAKVDVYLTILPGTKIPVYLIKHNLFSSRLVYTRINDFDRFSLWTRAALALLPNLDFIPDIIHLHDWHAALAVHFLPEFKQIYPAIFAKTKILYTIHSLPNKGYDKGTKINPMAEGLVGADYINTVSPTYAREILTKEYGAGLENILLRRRKVLSGILNGLDVKLFNPRTDKYIKYKYGPDTLRRKEKNKLALQKELGLDGGASHPLLVFVARFRWQKGVDLFSAELFDSAVGRFGAHFVFLGEGDPKYKKMLQAMAKKYPRQIKVVCRLDLALAQKLYAASDFFLMPSRFEPCGLTQMIAMRYGSIPLVRSTGGLKDTVNSRVGYAFKEYSPVVWSRLVLRALDDKKNRPEIYRLKQNAGMRSDFSWNQSAGEYLKLYRKVIKWKKQ
jgi:starch synthase